MRGGRALPPNFQAEITEEMEIEPEIQGENNDILASLGFEEGELEMFFDMAPNIVTEEQLIDRYLEIARIEPFNQAWQNENDAINADYELNVTKPNGVAYTKHDIANDVLNSFYDEISGGRHRKGRKQRKSKKHRKSKTKRRNRKTRRYKK